MLHFLKNSVRYPLLVLLAALMLLPLIEERQTATACWNAILTECFSNSPQSFPWVNPVGSGRQWRRSPNPQQDCWGIQEVVYSVRLQGLCGNDIQAAWMQGGTFTYDPDFDRYNPNRTIYMTYGPFSLANATDAVVQFELLCNSEFLGDSLTWGVAPTFNLTATNIMIDSAFSGRTIEQFGQAWAWIQMDLSDLHNSAGDSVSALGMATVYAFWWWKANGNTVSLNPLHNGAFVDNVIIKWDDGFLDLQSGGLAIVDTDTMGIEGSATIGDSVRARFTWNTCSGGIDAYPPTRVRVTTADPLGFETIVFDSLVQDVLQDTIYTWYTELWQLAMEGEHTVTVSIDPDNEIAESNETNNTTVSTVNAIPPNTPPTFIWLQPATDTLYADTFAVLKWEAYDPDDVATFSLYIDPDQSGCFGNVVPGGTGLTEQDGPDSIVWNCTSLIPNQSRYPFVLINDAQSPVQCIYAPFPVKRIILDAQELPVGIPDAFFLTQNYPNPFNPETEIRYGITRSGLVTLKVFDLLGREVATLVNRDLSPGTYVSLFNGRDLASGVYLYTLTSPEGTLNRKMVLMK
jgi:hypothetical protein